MIKALIFSAIAIFGGMLLLAAKSHAEDNAPVQSTYMLCEKRVPTIRMLRNTFGEKELFEGRLPASKIRIFVNPITKTFTLILDKGGEKVCMLGAGANWKIAIDGEDL